MQKFIQSLNIEFSHEEKQNCYPTARRLIDLFLFSQINGILALRDEVEKDSKFLKMGINLFLSATADAEAMEQVFCNLILSSSCDNEELLNKLLISQGIIMFGKQANPFLAAYSIGSILGEDYILELIDITEQDVNINLVLDKKLFHLPESENFQDTLSKLTDIEIWYLLDTVGYWVLAVALQGCSKEFINRIRNNIHTNKFIQICRALNQIPCDYDKEMIMENQNLILARLKKLEETDTFFTTHYKN
ncbi:MAG: hypothetical protein FWG63_09290 [Defluviitaleaceae bacterium]|nr:hypothetical protein [Defluviitaleaceae bacterium]